MVYMGLVSMLHESGLTPKNGLYEQAHRFTDMAIVNYGALEMQRANRRIEQLILWPTKFHYLQFQRQFPPRGTLRPRVARDFQARNGPILELARAPCRCYALPPDRNAYLEYSRSADV